MMEIIRMMVDVVVVLSRLDFMIVLGAVAAAVCFVAARAEWVRDGSDVAFDMLGGMTIMFMTWTVAAIASSFQGDRIAVFVPGTTMSVFTLFHLGGIGWGCMFFAGRRLLVWGRWHPTQRVAARGSSG